jgi:chemotaxis response regulator CheB
MNKERAPVNIFPADLDACEPEEAHLPVAVVPLVGFGASSGGLEVFKRLLVDLLADTGFAIAFIQHLNPATSARCRKSLGESPHARLRSD